MCLSVSPDSFPVLDSIRTRRHVSGCCSGHSQVANKRGRSFSFSSRHRSEGLQTEFPLVKAYSRKAPGSLILEMQHGSVSTAIPWESTVVKMGRRPL